MDTFFATTKAKKSSRSSQCMQLFETDKSYVYVVAMTKEAQAYDAIKLFAKNVGAPDAIICDAARAQILKKVWSFCLKMGTVLKILERATPWANHAELYIGLFKKSVCSDMILIALLFSGTTVLSNVCVSTTSLLRICFNLMVGTLILLSLAKKVTFQTYVNLNGTSGAIFLKKMTNSLFLARSLRKI